MTEYSDTGGVELSRTCLDCAYWRGDFCDWIVRADSPKPLALKNIPRKYLRASFSQPYIFCPAWKKGGLAAVLPEDK